MGNADALVEIRNRILLEMQCPLKDAATNLVFGKGNPEAKLMFIGEAPGKNEDLQGEPFVGQAGKQLDGLLNRIGLTLNDVYIANILKYRPPENRDPNPDEIRRHTPFLVEQIKAIKPKIIATLGNFSTKFVLADFNVDGMKAIGGITFLHGKPVEKTIDGLTFLVFPLYHPAACLYNRKLMPDLEHDFDELGKLLGERKRQAKPQKTLEEW
ncbi:MAG: uracil-DNA glycosylase [Candidatus Woesearchaeota archaeon]